MLDEIFWNLLLMLLCYAYILFIIVASSKLDKLLHVSRKVSRKFLHVMIGNLPFIIPFFTASIYPIMIAGPFVLITFFASPYSPFKRISKKLRGLADITEEGHQLGLVFYSISYVLLALFFTPKPYIIAAGILPMAYGDAAASLVGERYGKKRYRLFADKSFEGSAAMFLASFSIFTIGLLFFSRFYSFALLDAILVAIAVSTVAAVVEGLSPKGFDNLTVPFFGALTFVLFEGGV